MSDRWAPLQQLLEAGVSQGVFTAAVALVGLKGELRWEGAAGALSRDPGAAAVTLDTVFDLASLTKPLATALALMVLADRGQLKLATPPGRGSPGRLAAAGQASPDPHEPPHPPGRAAGLAALSTRRCWRPRPRPALPCWNAWPRPRPWSTPRTRQPYTATWASCCSRRWWSSLSGENLDRFCRETIYRPLGLATLGFNPLQASPGAKPSPRYAATEPGLIPGRPGGG